jgi:hypothetical protein
MGKSAKSRSGSNPCLSIVEIESVTSDPEWYLL